MTALTLILMLVGAKPDAGIASRDIASRDLATRDAGVPFKTVSISADQLEVRTKERTARYTGHAKALRDATVVRCDVLTVEYGNSNEVTMLRAEGHVEANDGDRWAWGDHATYDNRTGVLVLTGNPRARSGNKEVTGETVTFTSGTDHVDIVQPRTKTVTEAVDGGAPQTITINADALSLDTNASEATWRGHVVAKKKDTTLTSKTLRATYTASGEITHVVALGDAQAFDGNKWAKGERAEYTVATSEVVVTGNPQARQGSNRLRGTRVVFHSDSDFIEVENVTSVIEVEPKSRTK